MRNPFTRALSLVLALVLVLSLVPAVVFATDAETTEATLSSVVAINTTTGKTYESVRVAAEEVKTGETVQLTQNVTETTVSVYAGTLDLNGFTLKTDYMTCYGDLVDNSEDNTGLLIVPSQRFMLQDYNLQLPVKDGEGYRFVEVKGFNSAMIGDNKYAFQPLFEEDAHQYLAAGTEATGITFQVQVTWMEEEGQSSKRFVYNDTLLGGYIDSYKPASGKYGKMFTLTQKSTGTYEDIGFEAIVFSDTDVTFHAGISQPEKEEDEPVVKDENNQLVNPMTIYHKQGSAVVAAGTLLDNGATKLELTASLMSGTGSNVTVGNGEELLSMDVHVSGISEDNTVPVIITLNELAPEFLNKGNLALYHVEDGVTVPMTRVYSLAEVDAHNEYYYDIPTGTVTVAMATFSELTLTSVIDKAWMGQVDHTWYDPAKTELTIANADQLWSFSQIVGGMAKNSDGTEIAQDTFEGKTVKLLADINLADTIDENGRVFYPIGYYNSEKTYEKSGKAITSGVTAFRGTFDGQGHTIKNFYQNTWEMKGDDSYYAASEQRYNDAMGLFSATYDATVKNLVIENFSSDGEYTPTGCVAAYAGGKSQFINITLKNCNPRVYNTGNGGIVGLNYASTTAGKYDDILFENITVDNTNVITALWGSWDVGCGGVMGRLRESSHHGDSEGCLKNMVTFKNCHVSAVIDVFNDVCANYQYYQYRYSGMLVGTVDYMDQIVHVGLEDVVKFDVSGQGNEEDLEGVCTVHFGEWNNQWYCELVENTLASYTHDHQMSRLDKINDVSEIKNADGTWKVTGNFVIPDYENPENAVCYHIRKDADGNLYEHKHEDSGEETVDGQTVLKEDKQHLLFQFRQLFAGYGWGASHVFEKDVHGVVVLDIKADVANSIEKFEPIINSDTDDFDTGVEVTIGQLFGIKEDANLTDFPIDEDNVQVSVTPASDNSTAGAIYTPNTSDWTKGTLKFTGFGPAKVIINDYYFCLPTTALVNIAPAVELELVSHPVNTFDEKHTEATHVYLQIAAGAELDLADSTFDITVPEGWTYTSQVGTLNGTTWSGSGTIPGDQALILGYFTAPAEATAEEATFANVDLNVMGTDTSVDAIVEETVHMGHYGTWIPWTSKTTMPTEAGHYYLTEDVTLSRQAEVSTVKDVVVCLNGKTVTAEVPSGYSDRIYYVKYGGTVTICDCTAHVEDGVYVAGKLTGASHGVIMMPNLDENSTHKEQNKSTAFNLYDGLLTDNHLVVNGGAVLVQHDATFNMYGGEIRGNTNVPVDGKDGMGSGVYVGTRGHFNMYDGKIADNTSLRGSGIWVVGSSVVNIYKGEISGNKTWKDTTDQYMRNPGDEGFDATTAGEADAKYTFADDGTNFYNGSGAGIFLDSTSSAHIENATFANNKAWIRGGAIFAHGGTLEIVNSTFTGNEALTHKYKLSEKTTASAGEENGNAGQEGENQITYQAFESTGSGGAIFAGATTNLMVADCTISENKTSLNSGAVGVIGNTKTPTVTTALFRNVKILNNEIGNVGGAGIYTLGYTTVTLEGNNVITGNFGQTQGKTTVSGVYIANGQSTFIIKGNPVITGNGFKENGAIKHERNIYLQDNAGRTYVDEKGVTHNTPNPQLKLRNLTAGAKMTVYTPTNYDIADLSKWLNWKDDNFDPNNKNTYYGTWDSSYLTNTRFPNTYIWEDVVNHELVMWENTHGDAAGHVGEEKTAVWTPWYSTDSLPTQSGYYMLMNDLTVTRHTKLELPAKNVTLCLNGKTITGNNGDYGSVYYVTGADHQLTICDCSATGSATDGTLVAGKITGAGQIAVATPNMTANGETDENQGTVITLRDIIFKDNHNKKGTGGAVLVQEMALLKANNVLFENNSASGDAGAVYVDRGEGHQITNCAFTGNTATGHGSAIYQLCGALTMSGCNVTGNKITDTDGAWTLYDHAGAVHVMPDAKLILNGENVIDGNYEVNLIDGVETSVAESNIYLYNIQKTQDTGGGDEYDHPRVKFVNAPAGKVYETRSAVPFEAVSTGIQTPKQLKYSDYLTAENCSNNFTVLHTVPKNVQSTTKVWPDKVFEVGTYTYTETIFDLTQTISEVVTDLYVYVAADKAFYLRTHSGTYLDEHHEGAESVVWEAWGDDPDEENVLPTDSGHYYLTRNIRVMHQSTISAASAKDITLCLNGFTVYVGTSVQMYRLQGKDHQLTICDCTHKGSGEDYVTGKILGGTKAIVFTPADTDNAGTTINIRNVIFEGITRSSTEGVLHIQHDAKLNVDGVRFVNNVATAGNAGAIYLGDASADIKNSVFVGNSAANCGGAIYGNYNTTLYVENSVFTGNHAGKMGAAIYAGGDNGGCAVTLKDCSFTGNTLSDVSATTSGVVHVESKNLTLIGDNTFGYSVSLLAEGKTEAANIYMGTGKVIFKRISAEDTVIDIIMNAKPADGQLVVGTGEDVNKATFTVRVTAPFTENETTTDKTYTYIYNKVQNVLVENAHSSTFMTYHTGNEATATWTAWGDDANEKNRLPNASGCYYLTQDINLTSYANVTNNDQKITICLNGFTVNEVNDKAGNWSEIYYIKGQNNALTICDCTAHVDADNNYVAGVITGAERTAIGTPDSGDSNSGTVITVRDGIFRNNVMTVDNSGGVFCIQRGASVVIEGGLFENNSAKAGGVLYISGNGTATITGGTFRNNTATNGRGGAFYTSAIATISGAIITGNTSSDIGGGIYANTASSLTLNGGNEITDNTEYCNDAVNKAANDIRYTGTLTQNGTNTVGIIKTHSQQ